VGKIFAIDSPIINGYAHVTLGDSKWRVKGPNLPVGTIVRVVAVEGNTLIVEDNEL
jgi:hypothetical protein